MITSNSSKANRRQPRHRRARPKPKLSKPRLKRELETPPLTRPSQWTLPSNTNLSRFRERGHIMTCSKSSDTIKSILTHTFRITTPTSKGEVPILRTKTRRKLWNRTKPTIKAPSISMFSSPFLPSFPQICSWVTKCRLKMTWRSSKTLSTLFTMWDSNSRIPAKKQLFSITSIWEWMGTLERRRRTLSWNSRIWPPCQSTEWWMTTYGRDWFTSMRRSREKTRWEKWTRISSKSTKKSKNRFTRLNSPNNTPKCQMGGPPRTNPTTSQSNSRAISQWEELHQWEVPVTKKAPRKSRSQTEKCSSCLKTALRIQSSTWSRMGTTEVTRNTSKTPIRTEPRAWARSRAVLQCREWVE
jgi:hypothetical protein